LTKRKTYSTLYLWSHYRFAFPIFPPWTWNALRPEERKKFVPLAPDFVIELLSESDELSFAKIKMEEWMENGVRLAWLLDPFEKTSYIYRQNQKVEIISGIVTLKGEDVLPYFGLDLSEVYGEI